MPRYCTLQIDESLALTVSQAFAVGILWACTETPVTSISVSTSHLLTLGLLEGQTVRILPLSLTGPASRTPGIPSLKNAKDATDIRLKEIGDVPLKPTEKEKLEWLTLASREVLVDLKYVLAGQIFEVGFEGVRRRFSIESINAPVAQGKDDIVAELDRLSLSGNTQLWTTSWDTNVQIINNPAPEASSSSQQEEVKDYGYASIGGLSKQIEEIRDLLEIPLTRPELFRHFGLKPPRGILLHGPPGTGKTHLARAIAASTKSSVLVINGPELSSAYHGETESRLRQVFKDARDKSPCIVVLDEVDALVPRREEGAGGEVEKRTPLSDALGDSTGKSKLASPTRKHACPSSTFF
ncbi:hypothetical protein NMY22_g17125 [Coprinellus aureogranulatus]|nr:hypothetical protein NMY22_g17125 [Coprinellus aureogranulatus]